MSTIPTQKFSYFLLFAVLNMILCLYTTPTEGTNCEDTSIGVEAKGIIPDSSFTASSIYNQRCQPYFARLGYGGYGWIPRNQQNNNDYLQIDLGFEYFVCAIATRGWWKTAYVKTYKITMSKDKQTWTPYKENGRLKVFNANKDSTGVVKSSLMNKPLMRYIRLYPLTNYRYKAIKIAIYGYAKFEECITNPLGMQSGHIRNSHFSASSIQQPTNNPRLQTASSWCPTSNDSKPWLQIDLGSDHVICAVATQGSNVADQWVTSYRISISRYGSLLALYKESNVSRVFFGNYDQSTISRQILYDSPITRYVRIEPKTHHGAPCLRLEIYGYQLEPSCSKHSVGVPSKFIVPNPRFTASSYKHYYRPYMARLKSHSSWRPEKPQRNEYLQIDLGKVYRICAVLTQGDPKRNYWTTKYTLKYSDDNRLWKTYENLDGNEKVFTGNSDRSSIVTHSIKYPFKAKFIRVVVKEWSSHKALRVDFKGTAEACTTPLGVENKRQIPNSHLTSSSNYHGASRGRLYGRSARCSSTSSNTEYIQVDLGRVKTITGIATQGDPTQGHQDKWVTSYSVNYSFNSGFWFRYKEGNSTKAFPANTNKHDVIVNWLRRPIAARYVRIIPQNSNGWRCMRFDLYGCDFVLLPKATISPNDITLQSTNGSSQTLKCTVIGETSPNIQWFRNGTTMIPDATKDSLKVPFISAKDVISSYKCERKDLNSRLVICKMNYTCRAMFAIDVPSSEPAEATAQITVNLNLDVPGKVDFSAKPGNRSITLTWTPVRSDDVNRIIGYVIKLNSEEVRLQPSQTQYTFTNLKAYSNYSLQMKTLNFLSGGLWGDVKTVATSIVGPEGKPIVSAKGKSSTSIEVKWTLPASAKFNGPKTGFRITYTDAGGKRNTKQVGNIKNTVLNNLKKWTTYSITVSMWNSKYYGLESRIERTRTLQDAPDCPPILKSVEALSSTSIQVTWAPLPDTNCRNGVLRGYKVFYKSTSVDDWQTKNVGAHANSKDIINLQKYTTYIFSVVAYTVKDSNQSNTISKKTLQDAPDCPPVLKSAKALSSTSIRVTWDPLPNTNCRNGVLRGYRVLYRRSGARLSEKASVSNDVHSKEIKKLQKYTMYTFTVVAYTVKDSNPSNVITTRTKEDEPEGRASVSAEAKSSTSIEVTWKLPASAKFNGPRTGFRITYTDAGGKRNTKQVGNIRRMELTNLKKWMKYSISVSMWNSKYYGLKSRIVQTRTHEDAPDCPPVLKSVEALFSTSIRVTWDPPPNTNCRNGNLRGYKVLYMRRGTQYRQTAHVGANVNSKEIRYLKKYKMYAFSVVAYTVKDSGLSNEISRRTLQDAPSAPLIINKVKLIPPQGRARVPRVQITWDKPTNENGIISRYTLAYYYDNDSSNQRKVDITDISSLVYTMDVLGQTWFKFKMSASTIKEGPYTAIKSKRIPAYVPAVAPQGIRVTKQNETTFIIAWQPLPRDKANGVITNYKVSWILSHIGRAKRTAVSDTFTGTTKGTKFVLHSLRLCAHYEVLVAAATVTGSGPNATHSITTSKPSEAYNVRSRGKGKAFVTLTWEKPKGMIEDVKKYKVYFKGSKPYWPTYSFPVKNKTQNDGSQATLTIDNLQPGTHYEFWVIALTACGESNRSSSITVETEVDKPRTPQQGTPLNLKDSLNVTLWTTQPHNGPISSYQVIIISGRNKTMTEIPENLSNYQNASNNNEPFYITAELTPNQTTQMFVVGDNEMYGLYKNVALEKGQVYTVAERAMTRYKEKSYASDMVHIATIELTAELTKKLEKSKSSPARDFVIGVVVSLLAIVVILALLGFIYKRKRDAKNDHSAIALHDMNRQPDGNHVEVSAESSKLYVNVDVRGQAEGIKPMTKRQFLEYMKTLKDTDYSQLKEEFKMLSNTHASPVVMARKPANKTKNRYGNIVTYDNSRVVISRQADDEHSDYINASYIKGYDGKTKSYIATQGPMPETVADFWQMIWEVNSSTIVMLTNLKEGPKVKCHQYWPEENDTYRDFTVTIQKSEVFPDYILRTLLLEKSTDSNERRQINHFQFTVWPDHGVPQYSTTVLGLRRHVRTVNPDHAGPVVVHCSAGVGRTGAYIVIDAMLERARHLKNVAISDYVTSIRNDRPYMVQTEDQYVFIHLALHEVFTCGNTEIPVHNLQIAMRKLSNSDPQKKATGYALEFERLNRVTEDCAKQDCDVGRLPKNITKNRCKDNIALNRSRVLLNKPGVEDVTTSYINASHVDAYKERNAFIVTQAPLKKTIEDFWIMVASYDVKTIVMLNDMQEENKHFIQYWPDSGSSTYGHVTVELLDTTKIGQLISRHLNVTYNSTTVQVQHIQMPNWKDKCCPSNSQSVLDLLNEVEQSQRHAQSSSSPIVVQCSNGIGRSGTFCAIYSIIERVKQEQMVDVFQAIKGIRTNRPGAVETLDQYIYCYKIIQDYLDSFSDYANFSKC